MLYFIAFWIILLVAGPWIFRAVRSLLEEALDDERYTRPEAKGPIARGLAGLATLVVAGLALAILAAIDHEGALVVVAAGVVIAAGVFLKSWHDEFLALMSRGDDEFPGQSDKLVWAVALLFMPPFGVWFFRSYRKARWPEPQASTKPDPRAAGVAPDVL